MGLIYLEPSSTLTPLLFPHRAITITDPYPCMPLSNPSRAYKSKNICGLHSAYTHVIYIAMYGHGETHTWYFGWQDVCVARVVHRARTRDLASYVGLIIARGPITRFVFRRNDDIIIYHIGCAWKESRANKTDGCSNNIPDRALYDSLGFFRYFPRSSRRMKNHKRPLVGWARSVTK